MLAALLTRRHPSFSQAIENAQAAFPSDSACSLMNPEESGLIENSPQRCASVILRTM